MGGRSQKEMIAKNARIINFSGIFKIAIACHENFHLHLKLLFHRQLSAKISRYMPLRPIHFEHEKFSERVGVKNALEGKFKSQIKNSQFN